MRLFLSGIVVCLLCLSLSPAGAGKPSKGPYADEPELKGGGYTPPQPFLLDEDNRLNTGLADWSLVEDWPIKIKKMRVVGMTGYTKEDRLDWSTTDPSILTIVAEALSPGRMRRNALSDFSQSRGANFGDNLGVILLELDDRNFIIGVGEPCFYFGVWHGTVHQMFDSWLLAKQLDEILRDQTGKGLKAEVFARLSGEYNLTEQREAYEKLRVETKKND